MKAAYESKYQSRPCAKPDVPADGPERLHAELVAVTIRIAALGQTEAFSLPLGYAVVAIAALRADPTNRPRWEAAGRHVRGLVDQVTREEHQRMGVCLCEKWDAEEGGEHKALTSRPCSRCGMALR